MNNKKQVVVQIDIYKKFKTKNKKSILIKDM